MPETFWVVLVIYQMPDASCEKYSPCKQAIQFSLEHSVGNCFDLSNSRTGSMKKFPFTSARRPLARGRFRGKKCASREGASAVETTLVMMAIVGCLVFLMGGFSGRVGSVFGETERALGLEAEVGAQLDTQPGATSNAFRDQQRLQIQQANATEQILRMVIFTASVLVFLAYTVVFMSRAEAGNSPSETETQEVSGETKRRARRPTSFAAKLLNKRGKIGKILRDEMAEFDTDHLQVAKFMTPNPTLVSDNQTVAEVVNLIKTNGFRHLLVVDSAKNLTGIISDRDLVDLEGRELDSVMTADPISVEAETPVSIAITIMVKNRISALPVTHESKVVGILTNSDLLLTLQCLLVNVQEEFSHKDEVLN